MNKPRLAVIGASHFQLPLIQKAQEMGCEVHAFAWQCGDVGERAADVFHPVSIVETEQIVEECRRIGVQGVCTIASDLATVAVCHVADALGLVGNSLDCMRVSTQKHLMRQAFATAGDPSPQSVAVGPDDMANFDPLDYGLSYPLIVKPADRSGSRGVTKLDLPSAGTPVAKLKLKQALEEAIDQSLSKWAVVEEYATGDEFSVEGLSWEGEHHILTITRKATTGAPHFIETGHLQPAGLSNELYTRVCEVTTRALGTLGVRYGASHTELKIASDGTIRIIEIGARMGGDCIGSHLVPLSTGIDYVGAVINVALGNEPDLAPVGEPLVAAARFLFDENDVRLYHSLQQAHPKLIRYAYMTAHNTTGTVTDSSTRLGHFVMASPDASELADYLPEQLAPIAREALR